MITLKTAKELSIEKWQWNFDYPGEELPEHIENKIYYYLSHCPICTIYEYECKKCVIGKVSKCGLRVSYYSKWELAKTNKTRKKYAGLILNLIKNWDV